MVSSLGSIRIWNHVPSFDYLLFSGDDDLLGRKHIVVRGIIQSDTTRCEKYPVVAHNYVYISFPLDGMYYYYCFVDIMVKEYIVGEGPPKLTVIMHRENVYEEELDSTGKVRPEIIQFLKDPQSRTAEAYEGKEMVLFLGATITTSIESWDSTGVFSIWLVQQSDNGFRAVSQFRYVIPSLSSQLNLPLDEMTEDIKRAAKKRVALTGGRIGIDTALPMLVTDANRLREFYTTVGAVYEGDNATVLPPPAPGEDDPLRQPSRSTMVRLVRRPRYRVGNRRCRRRPTMQVQPPLLLRCRQRLLLLRIRLRLPPPLKMRNLQPPGLP